jgi:hypothetical protein
MAVSQADSMESVRERTSKEEPPLSHHTRIVDRKDNDGFARHLAKNGQLLPLVELIETSRLALDELIDVLRRATILRE